MSLSYIKRAEQGNRSALSFIATILICVGGLFVGQSIPIFLAAFIKAGMKGEDISNIDTTAKLIGYFPFPVSFGLLMTGFVVLIICLWICMKLFHRRKFSTLWSDQDRFRKKDFLLGLFISILLFVGTDLLTHFLSPADHKWVFDPAVYYLFVPLALVFIPLQTLSEELFFRGYLYQAFGLVGHNKWLAWLASGIVFGLFHFGNVEMDISFWKMGIVYIGSGLMIGLSVMFSKGIEFGWGFHLVNNLYLSLITNFKGSSLDGPTLYTIPKPSSDRILLEFGLMFLIFTLILVLVYRNNVKNLFVRAA